jgi:hypothetical protein
LSAAGAAVFLDFAAFASASISASLSSTAISTTLASSAFLAFSASFFIAAFLADLVVHQIRLFQQLLLLFQRESLEI